MVAAIEWDKIFQVIWVSILSGVAVMVLFSLTVYGSSRASERRRDGESPALFGLLAGVGFVGFMAIAVFAITVILNKS
jgi:hypothetical protein